MINLKEQILIRLKLKELNDLIRKISDYLSDENIDLPATIACGILSKDQYLETLVISNQEFNDMKKDEKMLIDLIAEINQLNEDYLQILNN